MKIPAVTATQMREVDRRMIEEYGIVLLQMMENAGRNLAELVRRLRGSSVEGLRVTVASGKGNNGGGGMVAARHLSNWGANVALLLPDGEIKGIPERQLRILEHLPIEIKKGLNAQNFPASWKSDILIDALIGYGLSGNPRGWVLGMIEMINQANLQVVSLDVPSGLDPTTGEIFNPCIRAAVTMTLALPKTGLLKLSARAVTGALYLADIGVPLSLYKEMGIETGSLFNNDTIINLDETWGGMA
jgi:NAD(P)H-hydrate epimerase